MRFGSGSGKTGINHHYLGTIFKSFEEIFHMRQVDIFTNMAPDQQHGLGVGHVYILIGNKTQGLHHGHGCLTTALVKGRFIFVGYTEVVEIGIGIMGRCAVIPDGNSLGTVLVNGCLQFIGADIQGLVPGNFLPFRGPAFTDVLHRIFQAIGIIDQFNARISPGAKVLSVVNGFGVALELYQAIPSDLADKLTTPEAHFTDTTGNGFGILETPGRDKGGLCNTGFSPGNHLGKRDASGCNGGGFQKIPPGQVYCHLLILLNKKRNELHRHLIQGVTKFRHELLIKGFKPWAKEGVEKFFRGCNLLLPIQTGEKLKFKADVVGRFGLIDDIKTVLPVKITRCFRGFAL